MLHAAPLEKDLAKGQIKSEIAIDVATNNGKVLMSSAARKGQ